VPHVLAVAEPHDLLHQLLPAVVGGVGLAGDDELDGPLGVEQQRPEPLGVAQHQGQALVRRNPPCEADRQDVRVEGRLGPGQLGLARTALQPRVAQPVADLLDEPGPQQPSY
jgi:hypothetical protein